MKCMYVLAFLMISCSLAGSQRQSPRNKNSTAEHTSGIKMTVVDGKEIPKNNVPKIPKQQVLEEPSVMNQVCCAALFYGSLYCIQTCSKLKAE